MRRKRQRGNVMVEFALGFSFLMPVLFGIFQFGYGLFLYNELNQAVRAGARYASLRKYDSATSTPSTQFTNSVRNTVLYGSPTTGAKPVVPGLTAANVNVSVTFEDSVPETVTVQIQNYSLDAFFWTFTLNKPAVSFPYTGVYASTP